MEDMYYEFAPLPPSSNSSSQEAMYYETIRELDTDPIVRSFSETEIWRITHGYNTPLGNGCFSEVYKGRLEDGRPVAVKRCHPTTRIKDLRREVTNQSRCRHGNIVELLGCCVHGDAPMVVTELVPDGDLATLLHGSRRRPPTLAVRLRVALGVAEALSYMHAARTEEGGRQVMILHGDVKPGNILIDEEEHHRAIAKLCDFGLSRLVHVDEDKRPGLVIGSKGYIDPDHQSGLLTIKYDVYSFGVVLLELITRRKGFDPDSNACLAEAFAQSDRKDQMFDKSVATDENMELLQGMADLALECLRPTRERPEMIKVLEELRRLKAFQENKVERLLQERKVSMREIKAALRESSFSRFITKEELDNIMNGSKQPPRSYQLFGRHTFPTERGLGKVYMGVLNNGVPVIVIKISHGIDVAWIKAFSEEIVLQSKVDHWHTTQLIGCCLDDPVDGPVLVYEHGYQTLDNASMQRVGFRPVFLVSLKIAIAAAEGLAHLHSLGLVHGDVRTANIIIDGFSESAVDISKVRPHLGQKDSFGLKLKLYCSLLDSFDFALKFLGFRQQHCRVKIAGYGASRLLFDNGQHGRFQTDKDVYNFGVVLVELFTGETLTLRDAYEGMERLWNKEPFMRCPHFGAIKSLAYRCFASEVMMVPPLQDVAHYLRSILGDLEGVGSCSCLET